MNDGFSLETRVEGTQNRSDVERSGSNPATQQHYAIERADGEDILSTLGDEGCRRLLGCLGDEARTVKELSDCCEMPSSTVYRKIDTLGQTGLIEERTKISTDGRHASEYVPRVDRITVEIIENESDVSGGEAMIDLAPQETSVECRLLARE